MYSVQDYYLNQFYRVLGSSYAQTERIIRISSVYVSEADAALICFSIENRIVYPVFCWRSEGDDYDVLAAAKRNEVDYFYLNADRTSSAGNNKNLLTQVFYREQIYPSVADPFNPAQGAIVYRQMDNNGQINFSRLEGASKLKEKIKRIRAAQPPDVMAFLQGLIKCRGHIW